MFLKKIKLPAACLFSFFVLTLTACHEAPSGKNGAEKSGDVTVTAAAENLPLPEMDVLMRETAKSLVKNRIEVSDADGLEKAWQKAAGNCEIVLRPGKYQLSEPLILDRNVTFRGTSSEEVTVECASGGCVFQIAGGSPRLENLKIVYHGVFRLNCAVKVLGGSPKIRNCVFISKFGNGIHLIGKNESAEVRSCVFLSCGDCGILAEGGASGEFADCEIRKNNSGVLIAEASSLKFQRCRICDNKIWGVCVVVNGLGCFRDCVINRTKGINVAAMKEGELTLIQCRISDGQCGGVTVFDGGKGTFHDNTLENNFEDGQKKNWRISSTAGRVTGSKNTPPLPDMPESESFQK